MGSWWSTRFALAAPHRVDALIHVGCPAMVLDTSAPLPMRLMGVRGLGDLLIRLQPPSPKRARFMLRMMGDPLGDGEADDAMADLLVAMQRLPDYRRAWLDLLHAFVGPRGARPQTALTEDDLRRLEMPVLFVWGEGDTFGSPDVGRRARRIIPDADVVTTPHCHVPWVSDAKSVAGPIRPGSYRAVDRSSDLDLIEAFAEEGIAVLTAASCVAVERADEGVQVF